MTFLLKQNPCLHLIQEKCKLNSNCGWGILGGGFIGPICTDPPTSGKKCWSLSNKEPQCVPKPQSKPTKPTILNLESISSSSPLNKNLICCKSLKDITYTWHDNKDGMACRDTYGLIMVPAHFCQNKPLPSSEPSQPSGFPRRKCPPPERPVGSVGQGLICKGTTAIRCQLKSKIRQGPPFISALGNTCRQNTLYYYCAGATKDEDSDFTSNPVPAGIICVPG